MRHQQILGCRHPIVAVAMNQVSDLNLALACHAAGALPSLSSFNHHVAGRLDQPQFLATLHEFSQRSGSSQLLLSLNLPDVFDTSLMSAIHGAGFRLVELFKWHVPPQAWQQVVARTQHLETDWGFRFFFKLHRCDDALDPAVKRSVFKGNEGAGRTAPDAWSLADNVARLQAQRPELEIIPSGGIGSAADVQAWLQRGVLAVGIGTLFAASAESCLSPNAKQKMVQALPSDLQRMGRLHTQGLWMSRPGRDNDNQSGALRQGIRAGDAGALFAGKGIAHVTEVLPVREIVARLLAPG